MERKKKVELSLGFVVFVILLICVLVFVGVRYIVPMIMDKDDNETKDSSKVEVVNTTAEDNKTTRSSDKKETTDGIEVVATMSDEISEDSSWCGTFQLVWNDMKDELVGGDVEFDPQIEVVDNLNKEEFSEDMISDEYYYKKYGLKTLDLKKEIEDGIKEKFNQTSDILDDFDWSEDGLDDPDDLDTNRYFFYTMLYREFEFLKKFDTLDNGSFGEDFDDVEYFGVNWETDESVREQIDVLYYNSEDDFAVVLNTKSDDEVIFVKNPDGSTFNEIYENMNGKAEKYKGSKVFEDIDEFKAPKLSFNEKKEYEELENKEFKTLRGTAQIVKAMQTIQFDLDEKGGKVKSEAAVDFLENTAVFDSEMNVPEPRYFYVDDDFAIFLREGGKDVPYFASRVHDVTKVQ